MAMQEAFTFSDVLLIPQRSSISSRKDVDTRGRISKNIFLQVPIISSNMDTVTESTMAIAMARCGGLGLIHRYSTIQQETEEVIRVKRAESIVIDEPYTLSPDQTVAQAREMMAHHQVGGLLVVGAAKKLLGVLTTRDLMFQNSSAKKVTELMSKQLITGKPGIDLETAEKLLQDHKVEKLPLVEKNGTLVGLITAKDLRKRKLYPRASKDKKGRLLVGASVGVVGDYLERTAEILKAGADVVVVDVAHGHADHVMKAVETIKKKWPQSEVVAGNVATYEGCRDLAAAGADGIRVGVGPGATCTTRIVTGSGVPQLSALLDTARITQEKDVPVIADGGIRDSGDITKALAAGASSVMLGQLLAGTEESPGWTVMKNGTKYKVYRGMASLAANLSRKQKERGEEDLGEEEVAQIVPEGVEAMVPYRGQVEEVVRQLVGGLRSGMSYCGSKNLEELWKKAKFARITPAGWFESKPHALEK
ncbi:MAG: IMP dehydrogenase [Elusimicrobia bacterium]|nr:IMP dehydrogenase [Elusimicrobiota bacterium]